MNSMLVNWGGFRIVRVKNSSLLLIRSVCLLPNPGFNLMADYVWMIMFLLLVQMKNVFGTPENTSLAIQIPGGTLSQVMER